MKPRSVETYPPAKLNLFLELLGKRSDGYHDLETVMIAINRCDRLRMTRVAEPGVRLRCQWSPSAAAWSARLGDRAGLDLPINDRNLVVRAVRQFQEHFNCSGGCDVWLDKCIPAGAGMGGASSDAASALLAAAAVWDVPADEPALRRIAGELGSDVPFFLGAAGGRALSADRSDAVTSVTAGAAIATGRGEEICPLASASNLHFVIVYPPEPLSTAAVFGQCRVPERPISSADCRAALQRRRGVPMQDGRMRDDLIRRGQIHNGMFNRLTEPAREMSFWIDRTIDAICDAGLANATMTGSGSACFGVARSAATARRAAALLSSRRLGICFPATPTAIPARLRFLT